MTSVPHHNDSLRKTYQKKKVKPPSKLRSTSSMGVNKSIENLSDNIPRTRKKRSRSHSCDNNWESIFAACDQLEKHIVTLKEDSDIIFKDNLQTIIPNMRPTCDEKLFQGSLDKISLLFKQVIGLSVKQLKEGKLAGIVSKLLLIQQEWSDLWPSKSIITKALLEISKTTRIVNFLIDARTKQQTLKEHESRKKKSKTPIGYARIRSGRQSEPFANIEDNPLFLPSKSSFTYKQRSKEKLTEETDTLHSANSPIQRNTNSNQTKFVPGIKKQSSSSEYKFVDEEEYMNCRICDQPVFFDDWENHKKKCLPITSVIQKFRKQSNEIDSKIVKNISLLDELLKSKELSKELSSIVSKLCKELLILNEIPISDTKKAINKCNNITILLQKSELSHKKTSPIITTLQDTLDLKYSLLEDIEKALAKDNSIIYHKPSIDDFEIVKPISKGAYGRVFLVRKKATGDLYAMKVIRKSDTKQKNQQKNIIMERNILHTVQSPFVVRLFYTFQNEECLFWVMEYVQGGDLYSLLRGLQCFDEDMAKAYAAEIVLALEYCHSKGIVHRDLKPDNLLVNIDGHIKLTDFGLSRYGLQDLDIYSAFPGEDPKSENIQIFSPLFQNSEENLHDMIPSDNIGLRTLSSKVGTPDYLAPEVILGQGHGKEVDWWALGVIIYEFILGFPPFNADTTAEIFENIVGLNICWPDNDEELSPEARDLVSRLLVLDPNERIGVQEIKQHPFFDGIEWDTICETPGIFIPPVENDIDTSFFDVSERNGESFQLDIDSITNSQISPRIQRVEYSDSSSEEQEELEIGEIGASNPYINFSFMNLPNLEALSEETFAKNSPRTLLHTSINHEEKEEKHIFSDSSESLDDIYSYEEDSEEDE